MHKVLTDVYITRKQRMCHVFDETDTLQWSGKFVADALHWLIENGQVEARLEGETHNFLLAIKPLPD